MPQKKVERLIKDIFNVIPDDITVTVFGEALGRVVASVLSSESDEAFEIWIKAVRNSRDYFRKHRGETMQ